MDSSWDEEYRSLINRGIELGRVQILSGEAEKRLHPRYRVQKGAVRCFTERGYPLIDKSLSGLAFFSPFAFPVGQTVRISLRRFFVVDALVVGCEMQETEPLFLECQYKIRCRFQSLDPQLLHVLVVTDMERDARPNLHG